MTNAINATPMARGLARDGRGRPVNVVEHPAFRRRRTRRVGAVSVGRLGALRVVSLLPEVGTHKSPRVATASIIATPSILEAA